MNSHHNPPNILKGSFMFRFSIFFVFLAFYAASFAQDITPIGNLGFPAVVVSNTEAWTSTGIILTKDSSYVILVQGVAATNGNTVSNTDLWIGPEGMGGPDWMMAPDGPLPGAASHSVIGKIGSTGTTFYIGKNCSFKANVIGELYLGINDKDFSDNYGYYVAFITKYHHGLPPDLVEKTQGFPENISISQNYPNPFNPNTNIEYKITKQGNVEIGIYDINGRLVKSLLNTTQHAGSYTIQWNGQDENGGVVSSGTYFYQVKSDGVQLVKKMLMLK
ncbi:MAG: hypothetical protein C0417_04480 [Chlorobiaceae bacterium]|nr:hypothetical protein [Chlorobiaceae bacterium]